MNQQPITEPIETNESSVSPPAPVPRPVHVAEPAASTGMGTDEAAALPSVEPDTPVPAVEGSTLTEALADLAAENARLKTAVQLAEARATLTGELARSGARSPELLFELTKSRLEFDDDGLPANASALITHLRETYPEQFHSAIPGRIDGGAGVIQPSRLTRDALSRMSPDEIARLDWSEVRRALETK